MPSRQERRTNALDSFGSSFPVKSARPYSGPLHYFFGWSCSLTGFGAGCAAVSCFLSPAWSSAEFCLTWVSGCFGGETAGFAAAFTGAFEGVLEWLLIIYSLIFRGSVTCAFRRSDVTRVTCHPAASTCPHTSDGGHVRWTAFWVLRAIHATAFPPSPVNSVYVSAATQTDESGEGCHPFTKVAAQTKS
jgi:hypothetical protein